MIDRMISRTSVARGITLASALALGASSIRAETVSEQEDNDAHVIRQLLGPTVRTVTGELGDGDRLIDVRSPDEAFSGSLTSGLVTQHTRTGFPPGTPYVAIIDNTPFGGNFGPDTMLGSFTEFGQLVAFGDDGSPLGNGYASALSDIVNDDGSMRFRVTGYGDFNFDGFDDDFDFPHLEEGPYQLYVYMGVDSVDDLQDDVGDVDHFAFSGLTPGANFIARITDAQFDPMLFWMDDQGGIIESDDDDGGGVLPLLAGIVPDDGRVNLAVSAFPDLDLRRDHNETGAYTLTIEEVSAAVLGDMNGDGVLDAFDVAPFELALADAAAYAAAYPNLDPVEQGDFDGSGALDAFDVAPFEAALAGAGGMSVPEPASLYLLAAGMGVLLRRRAER